MATSLAFQYAIEEEFSDFERQRADALRHLISNLRDGSSEGDEFFSKVFRKATQVLELEDLELARMLRVSRPTIGRWARGESAPHRLGRGPVLRVLAKIADSKLRHHSQDSRARVAA